MTIDVAIDPGVRALGWAASYERSIVACGVSRLSDTTDLAALAYAHAIQIRAGMRALPLARGVRVAVESMRWRPNDPKSQPNDLLDVQTVGALCAAHLAGGTIPRLVPPQEWKRNLPKAVIHNRLRSILSEDEIAIVDDALDRAPAAHAKEILDAVGISLYTTGRVDSAGRKTTK